MTNSSEKSENSAQFDIIIISYNGRELTKNCIDSIINSTNGSVPNIIVVDNASDDKTIEFLNENYPFVKTIYNERNLGYAAAVNIGVKSCNSEFCLVTNNDVIFHENSISTLIQSMLENSEIGIAGPQQMYSDGSWEYSYGELPGVKLGLQNLFLITSARQNISRFLWNRNRKKIVNYSKEVGYIDGAVMCIRRKAFESVSGFDEDFFFYTEEADFAKRLKIAGWKASFLSGSVVTHLRGGSSAPMGVKEENTLAFINSKFIYCKKHLSPLQTKAYAVLELLHINGLFLLWSFFRFITWGKIRAYSSHKSCATRTILKAWIIDLRNYNGK